MNGQNSITHEPHYKKAIISLAWPIFVEQLLVSLVQAADSAMVGSLGAAATAAIAINYPLTMLINGIIMAFGIGFTSMIARNIGAKNFDRAKRLTKQAVIIIIIIGIPMTMFCYGFAREIPVWFGAHAEILDGAEIYNQILALSLILRSITMVLTAIYRGYGDSKTPMKVNIFVNILNVIGNFFMIYPSRHMTVLGMSFPMFGFGWGVAGAAISTSLSGAIGGIILLTISFVRKGNMQIKLFDGLNPDWHDMPSVMKISFPAMLERFIMSSAFMVVGRAVASLGTTAIAAQNLSGTAESLSFMPGFAFGTAVTTLFAQSIGAREYDEAHRYVVETIKIGSVIMAFMTVIMFVFSVPIMSIFTPDPEVIRMGAVIMKLSATIQIPQMISSVYSGALKGSGDSKSCFIISLVSMWGIRLLGTVICVHVLHMGLAEANVCICADCAFRCLLFHLKYKKGSWKKAHA